VISVLRDKIDLNSNDYLFIMSNFAKPLSGVWAQRVANQQVANQPVPSQQDNQEVANQSVPSQSVSSQQSNRRQQSGGRHQSNHRQQPVGHRYTVTVNEEVQKPLPYGRLNKEAQQAVNTAQEYLTNLCVEELKKGLQSNNDLQCMDYLTSVNVRLYVDGSNVVVGEHTVNCDELVSDVVWVKRTREALRKLAPSVYFNFFHNNSNNRLVVTVSR
jgi:hypothetical protein